jgi:TonB-dependent starch-binding outer membrane protein SusC
MKKLLQKCMLIIVMFMTVKQVNAQDQHIIQGTVTSKEDSQPLRGVNIMVKGTHVGTTTDLKGAYSLKVSDSDAALEFSFSGYISETVALGKNTTLDVQLEPDTKVLESVALVGYGTQKRIEVTSAVATVKSGEFVKGSVKDIGQLLQGKVAGLTIGTPSGDPNASSQILLRGIATLFSSTQPLILVDGIPGGLNSVAPEDIERIDVLKDGSAAAIYGTRGTNGVILVTTKQPNGNIEPTISYTGYVSTQSFVNLPDMLTAEQYRKRLADGTKGFQDYGGSTDWIKEISRKSPISHSHQISINGGNAKTNYLATLGYRNLEGVLITTQGRTVNSRVDVNHKMFNNKLKLNINYINNDNKKSVDFDNVVFRNAVRYNPTSPVYNPNGTYFENFNPTENFNPVAMLKEQFGDNQSQSTRISGSATWTPVKDLNLKALLSRNKYNMVSGYGQTKKHYSNTRNGLNGYASKNDYQSTDQLMELTGEYSKVINLNKFTALAGYSYQDNISENSRMSNYDFPVGNYSYIDNIGIGNALKIGQGTQYSHKQESNLIGFFGRVTYNYDEKYLLMASLRREAASQLIGTKQPWGNFPSVSIGWRVNEEKFMKKLDFLDNLKVRAGYGVTGTSPDALFLAIPRLGYSGSFLINGQWQPSIVPISNPNPYLKWEQKKETNIGLDFSVLKGKISGNVDFYNRRTEGLLFDYQVPSPPNLFRTTTANVGVMQNKGLEALVTVIPVQTNKFTWTSGMTFSTNRNKLLSLENDLYKTTNPFFDAGRTPTPIGDISHRIEVGQPIGNFWGFKVIDVTEDGHWVYEDGNGKPITTIPDPANDRKVIGNGLPKYYAGWNNTLQYGNFDLNITMRGAFGFQIINSQRMLFENPGFQGYNQMNSAYDNVFGKTVLNTDVNVEFNSYYIENGNYWKIDNATLGYNFKLSGVKHIKSARLYVSTLNTFTFTKYKGMDPEVNQLGLIPGYDDREKYPTARIYTLGMNISFN